MPAISLGLFTTLIGYSALAIAPFPGLRQIAVFALIGLISAFASVVLWFPLLDRLAPLRHGASMIKVAALPWIFWTMPRYRLARGLLMAGCAAILVIGLAGYRADDDVRRLQVLSPSLLVDQQHLQRLMGANIEAQHILVSAADDEAALQRQERLIPTLDRPGRGGRAPRLSDAGRLHSVAGPPGERPCPGEGEAPCPASRPASRPARIETTVRHRPSLHRN